MSLFDRDRIGVNVLCEVLHGSWAREDGTMQGHVRWTHAKEGLVVGSIKTINRGTLKGPWIVQKVDVPFVNMMPFGDDI